MGLQPNRQRQLFSSAFAFTVQTAKIQGVSTDRSGARGATPPGGTWPTWTPSRTASRQGGSGSARGTWRKKPGLVTSKKQKGRLHSRLNLILCYINAFGTFATLTEITMHKRVISNFSSFSPDFLKLALSICPHSFTLSVCVLSQQSHTPTSCQTFLSTHLKSYIHPRTTLFPKITFSLSWMARRKAKVPAPGKKKKFVRVVK